MNDLKEIIDEIQNAKQICIAFHQSPDGDALGSAISLTLGLRTLGKKVKILSKESIDEDFLYLPLSSEINGKSSTVSENCDCLIVLDCGNTERINADVNLSNRKYKLINIDHHLSNDFYGDLNYVDSNSAAACEIVYKLLKEMNVKIEKEIAVPIYTSLITDSGSFEYSNTTAYTHFVAGEMIKTGIDFTSIHRRLFENKKIERIKLYGDVIRNLYLVEDSSICIIKITKELLKKYNIPSNSDTSDIVNIGMNIDTVEVSVLIKEVDDGVKISLRSKSKVDVRKVAEEFNGGGHVRAAGCHMKNNIDEAEKMIIDCIKKRAVQLR